MTSNGGDICSIIQVISETYVGGSLMLWKSRTGDNIDRESSIGSVHASFRQHGSSGNASLHFELHPNDEYSKEPT